jgi:hypothetical protein
MSHHTRQPNGFLLKPYVVLIRNPHLRSIVGGLLLALCLAPAFSVRAVPIESHPGPIVNNTNDHGAGSLRQALRQAQEGDTITFAIPTSDPGYDIDAWTISLTSGELAIDKDVTISGPGASHLVLKRGRNAPAFSIFPAHPEHTIAIEGLRIADNFAPPTPFALLTGGTAAVVAMSAVLLFRHFLRRHERRVRFGLLWDGRRQPLCVKCGAALRVLNDFSFQCPSCQVELGAQGDNGRTIPPHEALARIRLKEYWS